MFGEKGYLRIKFSSCLPPLYIFCARYFFKFLGRFLLAFLSLFFFFLPVYISRFLKKTDKETCKRSSDRDSIRSSCSFRKFDAYSTKIFGKIREKNLHIP